MALMPASRGRVHRQSELGDSWVVNDSDSDEPSCEEYQPSSPERPARRPASNSKITPIPGQSDPRHWSSRASSAVPEPELIMPSIHEGQVEGPWPNKNRGATATTSPRKRTSNSVEASFGDKSRPSRRVSRTNQSGRTEKPYRSKDVDSESPTNRALSILGYSAEWLLDVLGGALKALRKPLSWFIAIYLFLGLLVLGRNLLTRSIYSAISPVCRIPGMSLLGLPICRTYPSEAARIGADAPVEFDRLMTVQDQFEELLDAAATGVALPFDMKRSEAAVRDLRQLVRFSHLQSKNAMLLELNDFIDTARSASYDLQKFNSRVGRGVDSVLATARWTQKVLDDLAIKKSSRGLLPAFIQDTFLAPFQPLAYGENALLDQYIQYMRVVSDEINSLLDEAQALLYVLQSLEDRLDTIHDIALPEEIHTQGQKDEILSRLWTLLGGNRAALGDFNSRLRLLHQVVEFRKVAWGHVSATIIRLQAMSTELETLRERVGSAEVGRNNKDIPLTVHLESIKLGVERLENSREASRELSQSYINKVLDRGGKDNEIRLVDG